MCYDTNGNAIARNQTIIEQELLSSGNNSFKRGIIKFGRKGKGQKPSLYFCKEKTSLQTLFRIKLPSKPIRVQKI